MTSPAMAAACRLAVLGDSLTAGHGVALEQAFPPQLERALQQRGLTCTVLNAGVSGDTAAGGAARTAWVLADQPTHMLVELGANDGLRALPAAQMEENLASIVQTAQAAGVKVMLAGMLAPPNLGLDYGKAFQEVYPRLAQRYQVPLYPFFLEGLQGRHDLIQSDGLHPTAAGVAVVVKNIAPHVYKWIENSP